MIPLLFVLGLAVEPIPSSGWDVSNAGAVSGIYVIGQAEVDAVSIGNAADTITFTVGARGGAFPAEAWTAPNPRAVGAVDVVFFAFMGLCLLVALGLLVCAVVQFFRPEREPPFLSDDARREDLLEAVAQRFGRGEITVEQLEAETERIVREPLKPAPLQPRIIGG